MSQPERYIAANTSEPNNLSAIRIRLDKAIAEIQLALDCDAKGLNFEEAGGIFRAIRKAWVATYHAITEIQEIAEHKTFDR